MLILQEKDIEEINQKSIKIEKLKTEYLKMLSNGIDMELIMSLIQFDYGNRDSIVSMLFDDSYRQEVMDIIKIETPEDAQNNLLALFLANQEYIEKIERQRRREKSYDLLIGDES